MRSAASLIRAFIYHRVSELSLLLAHRFLGRAPYGSSPLPFFHTHTHTHLVQSSIDCTRRAIRMRRSSCSLARSFSYESVGALATRGGQLRVHEGGFIFTRMAGSRASWHNANGHSRTFTASLSRCPGRWFASTDRPTGAGRRRRRRCMQPEHSRVLYIIDKRPYRELPPPPCRYLPPDCVHLLSPL